MSKLKIILFGRFQFLHDEVCIQIPNRAKELLCYLLLNRNRNHLRESVANTLWGEVPNQHPRKQLRQAIWQLKLALKTVSDFRDSVLEFNDNWIKIQICKPVWLDVDQFEDAYNQVRGRPGEQLNEASVNKIKEALALYSGELLEGWHCDWCIFERERLQNNYLAMLDKLARFHGTHHEYAAGLEYVDHILSYDRARERTHRQKIRLLYFSGNRIAALRQFHICSKILKDELGVPPSKQTLALYEQIHHDSLETPAVMRNSSQKEQGAPKDETASLEELLINLKHFRITLGVMQDQLENDIQRVEDAIHK
jgi:DNA-binding SARP family transcriptional activator